jgi:outer membrane protein OmpA-like peptidoglycan-associated protein
MKTSRNFSGMCWKIGMLSLVTMFIFSGCATKKYVGEQVTPVADRVTAIETKVGQADGKFTELGNRVTADEGKITSLESGLAKTDAKAERALASLSGLKVERKLVLATDKKDGANFGINSSDLSDKTKQDIDAFLGTFTSGPGVILLVAGYTDNSGSEDFNYDLGLSRAEAVKRYLVTQKNIDPIQVVMVSYGEGSPIADNKTKEGRAQNRRVEISVYREVISTNVSK